MTMGRGAGRALLAGIALACLASPAAALTNSTSTSLFGHVGNVVGTNGVLISPNWVLTAAHVAGGVTLGTSSFASGAGTAVIDGRYWFESPLRIIGNNVPANDIALLHLSGNGFAATPFPILNSRVIDNNVIATLTANQLNTATLTDSVNSATRHSGTAPLDVAVPTYTNLSNRTFPVNWLVTSGPTHVEGGDSGGGLFFGTPGDSAGAYLLGIASVLLTEPGLNPSFFSGYTQVATYRDWIDQTIQKAAGAQAASQLPQWGAIPVPEPASWLLMLVGLGWLSRHRSARLRAPLNAGFGLVFVKTDVVRDAVSGKKCALAQPPRRRPLRTQARSPGGKTP